MCLPKNLTQPARRGLMPGTRKVARNATTVRARDAISGLYFSSGPLRAAYAIAFAANPVK